MIITETIQNKPEHMQKHGAYERAYGIIAPKMQKCLRTCLRTHAKVPTAVPTLLYSYYKYYSRRYHKQNISSTRTALPYIEGFSFCFFLCKEGEECQL